MPVGNRVFSFREKRCCMLQPVCGYNYAGNLFGPLLQWEIRRDTKHRVLGKA